MPISAAQKEQRKSQLGSSDMAAVLGLDPFKNAYDVWLDKTNRLEEKNESNAMFAGTMFEDGVLRYAETELGKMVRNQYRSAKDRGIPLGANIDAILVGSNQPVEAKTAGLFGPLRDIWGEQGTDEVPDRVLIQAHVHMVCSQSEICHVPAFLGGRGFQMFHVVRDSNIAEIVSETAVQFWQKHVLGNAPPDNSLPHVTSIKSIRRQPASIVEIEQRLVDEWLMAKAVVKEAEEQKEQKEIAMLTALGDAEGGTTDAGMLTYLAQSRTTIDAKTLKVDAPDLYEKYARVSAYRVPRFKAAK